MNSQWPLFPIKVHVIEWDLTTAGLVAKVAWDGSLGNPVAAVLVPLIAKPNSGASRPGPFPLCLCAGGVPKCQPAADDVEPLWHALDTSSLNRSGETLNAFDWPTDAPYAEIVLLASSPDDPRWAPPLFARSLDGGNLLDESNAPLITGATISDDEIAAAISKNLNDHARDDHRKALERPSTP